MSDRDDEQETVDNVFDEFESDIYSTESDWWEDWEDDIEYEDEV